MSGVPGQPGGVCRIYAWRLTASEGKGIAGTVSEVGGKWSVMKHEHSQLNMCAYANQLQPFSVVQATGIKQPSQNWSREVNRPSHF